MRDDVRIAIGRLFWREFLKPLLFTQDPENAHFFTIRTLKFMQDCNMLWALKLLYRSPYTNQPIMVCSVPWRNPVGLAAGFDKHAEVLPALDALGFGSAEVGTGPPRPQPGADRPRVFRYPKKQALINRYAFNSHGIEVVRERIRALTFGRFPTSFWSRRMPIGVSIGKNAQTPDKDAINDYVSAFTTIVPVLRPGIDWVQINISSPNTKNLRDIFSRLDEFLGEFVDRAEESIQKRRRGEMRIHKIPSLVLKVSPDNLKEDDFSRISAICEKYGFAGIEATNTTTNETIKRAYGLNEEGGLSGWPLFEPSNEVLEKFKKVTPDTIDLIGVGGIMSAEHARIKRQFGARAIQLYSGLVFRGPTLIHDILKEWPQNHQS